MDKPRRLVVIDDDPEIGKIVTDAANLFGIPVPSARLPAEIDFFSDKPRSALGGG